MFRVLIAIVLTAFVAGCETPDGLIGSEVSFLPDMDANSVPASAVLLAREDGVADEVT